MNQRRKRISGIAAATAGLTFNLLWCTLMGHTPGFLLSSLGLGELVNARTFWLIGILLLSVVLAFASGWVERNRRHFPLVMPLVSSVGTACFALSFHQDFFSPTLLATTGLTAAGLGYLWYVSRLVLLLGRRCGFGCAVACIVASFPLRQLASLALDSIMGPEQQVFVAIALPVATALCLLGAGRALGSAAPAEDERRLKPPVQAADAAVVLVVVGVLLAMVRAFGPSGVWGDSNTVYFSLIGRVPAIALLTACLALFAWATLWLTRGLALNVRFQPAILVIIAGLFIVVLRSQIGPMAQPVLDSIVQLNDPFAHLLFWAAVAAVARTGVLGENRVVGIAGVAYGVSSLAWVLALKGDPVVETAVILVIVALIMNRSWIASLGRGASSDANSRADADAAADDAASRLSRSIEERCLEMARECGLSPRETEVFLLLAQGRTNSYIQKTLVLAESTVKTHMSHIYTKLGVTGRQDMVELIYAGDTED